MRNSGLTLLEIMISVLVLGLGMTAVAGLFPIAGTIQRNTYDDMVTTQMGDSVGATIGSRGFSATDLMLDVQSPAGPADVINASLVLTNRVSTVPPDVLDGQQNPLYINALIEWGPRDRGYPTSMPGDPADRPYWWVPLARNVTRLDAASITAWSNGVVKSVPTLPSLTLNNWEVFVFVLKKEHGVVYRNLSAAVVSPLPIANPDDGAKVPFVRAALVVEIATGAGKNLLKLDLAGASVSDLFEAGDWVLDSDGVVRRVTDVDGDKSVMEVDGPINTSAPAKELLNSVTTLNGSAGPAKWLWFADRRDAGGTPRPSPTRRILMLGGGVVLR